jgi:hypothetical protein
MNVVYMLACLSDAPMPTKSSNQHGNLCSRQHQNKGNIITSIDGRERWRGDQMEGWMLCQSCTDHAIIWLLIMKPIWVQYNQFS